MRSLYRFYLCDNSQSDRIAGIDSGDGVRGINSDQIELIVEGWNINLYYFTTLIQQAEKLVHCKILTS